MLDAPCRRSLADAVPDRRGLTTDARRPRVCGGGGYFRATPYRRSAATEDLQISPEPLQGRAWVQIIWDRRRGERRQSSSAADSGRRRSDRRTSAPDFLVTPGFIIVMREQGASQPKDGGTVSHRGVTGPSNSGSLGPPLVRPARQGGCLTESRARITLYARLHRVGALGEAFP